MLEILAAGAVALLVGFTLAANAWTTGRGLLRATAMQLSDTGELSLPVHPEAKLRTPILPVSGIDGKWWVIHSAASTLESPRVRSTELDNAPQGREVHWSSGPMWFLAVGRGILTAWTGMSATDAAAWLAMWSGPVAFAILLAAFGWLASRSLGLLPALSGVLAMATAAPVFEFFRVGNFDHHGLVGWLAAACVLCFGVALRAEPRGRGGEAFSRLWFALSAAFGGAGLWVSAATQIPVLAALAGTAFAALMLLRRSGGASPMQPEDWVLWGRVGAAVSLGFYLLEYFPVHMGWRLEVNHPLYSLAWLGGAHLLASLTALVFPRKGRPGSLLTLTNAGWLALLVAPVAVILIGRDQVFLVSNSFLLDLHNRFIGEFQNVGEATSGPMQWLILVQIFALPVACCIFGLCLVVPARRDLRSILPALVASGPAFFVLLMGVRQVRWLGIALMLWSVVVVFLIASGGRWVRRPQSLSGWALAVLAVALSVIVFLTTPALTMLSLLRTGSVATIPRALAPNIVARDVIQRLLRSDPSRLPVVLSGPTTSTDIAYYGGVKTIGTLYWENAGGLLAAANILSAPTADSALKQLTERGITHILLFSWDDFSKDYTDLLRAAGRPEADPSAIFVARLQDGSEMPQWIRPLAYPLPPGLGLEGEAVSLYEIRPTQGRKEALVAQALYHLDMKKPRSAIPLLEKVIAEFPGDAVPPVLLREARAQAAAGSP